MPNGKVRVVGSNYTTFAYKGKALALCEQVEDSGQRAFSDTGQPYEFITPLGANHPIEVATSRVLQGATLTLSIREAWNYPVWYELSGLARALNIVDIYSLLAQDPSFVTCTTVIKPPGTQNTPSAWRGKIHHNCTVVEINDGDTISIGALSVLKNITIAYTHSSRLN